MDKLLYIYIGLLPNHYKKEILPFAITWMDLEGIMLSKISQTDKDKYHMILLTCGVKNKPKLIESKNRLVVGRGTGGGMGEGGSKDTNFQL